MTAVYDRHGIAVYHGDCLDVMRTLAEASVHALVTDPPYSLGFMGRKWDSHDTPFAFQKWCQQWASEGLRVLKPGGYLLAFGGTRTFHRLTTGIEDAGFEIRDSIGHSFGMLAWVYGSGFPKSRAVSRDPRFCQCLPGVPGTPTEDAAESAAKVLLADLHGGRPDDIANVADLHGVSVSIHPDYAVPGGAEQDLFGGVRESQHVSGEERPPVAARSAGDGAVRSMRHSSEAPATSAEAEHSGVLFAQLSSDGTSGDAAGQRLRRNGQAGSPPIRLGQPSLEGRGDVQAGEGELRRPEIRPVPSGPAGDGAVGRVRDGAPAGDGPLGWPAVTAGGVRESHRPGSSEQRQGEPGAVSDQRGSQAWRGWPVCAGCGKQRVPAGLGTALKPAWEPIIVARKPLAGTVAANVTEHGTGALNIGGCRVGSDTNRGDRYRGKAPGGRSDIFDRLAKDKAWDVPAGRWPANTVFSHGPKRTTHDAGMFGVGQPGHIYSDSGGASRFFPTFRYEAKAPTVERPKLNGQAHPTVKPIGLMRWMVRLTCPPGGTVLDPFAGTGTTGHAARAEGFRAVLIEQDADHIPLIVSRLDGYRAPVVLDQVTGKAEPMDLLDLLDGEAS